MRFKRIEWRDAIKLFRLGAVALHCLGCKAQDPVGAVRWYIDETNYGPWCEPCMVKLRQVDSTHSVTVFYGDTRGKTLALDRRPPQE